MSPPVLNQMLRYAKEAYLYGHLDYVATTLKAYIQWMKAYRNAPEWNDLDDQQQADVLAVKDESVSLYQQLRSNQDYFGNPVGWVPMLSFEVNQAAFEQEVDRAMDILYLTYSLGGGARTLQQQKETAQTLKEKLEEEVISAKAEYNETVRSVPGLQAEIDRISQGISIAKRDIQTLRDELLRQAKDAAFIRSIGNTLIKVSEVIPATQPLLSFTGNVIAGIPDIDPNAPLERTLVGVAKNSAGEALKQYQTQMIDQQLADADELANCSLPPKACLALLGAKKANELRGPLNNVLDRTTELFIERSAPSPEVEAELDRILADEPRFAAIIARLEKLNAQKADFAVRYMETMTKINRLATQITQSMLSISVLHGVIRDVLSVLDPAVVAHVADMQQRARHRLQLYQYYMVKAYEYRLIKPYSGDRDINALFDDVCKLATAVKENDLGEGLSGDGCGNNSAPVLSKDDFDTLKGLFDDQIGEVVFEILDGYNSGTAPQERSRSVPVASARLVPVINQLNVRQEPKLNLYELGLFPGSRENLRLTGVRVTNVEFEYIGARSDVTEIDICFRHSGTTRLRQDGETYLFRHYNERTRSPIQWCSQYVPQTASLNQILPSAAQASLLRAQLGSAGSQDTLLLFSRPGAWADLSVTMEVNAFGNSTARIKRMDLEASYDYVDKAGGHVLLEVRPENPALSPLIKLSNPDRNGRKDGQGSFDRSFNPGAQVTIEAPQRYGSWVFAGWAGASNSTANRIAVPLSRDASLQARYVKGAGPGPVDTDRDGIPDDTDPDDDNDGMTDVWERAYGLNPLDSGDAAIDSDSDGVNNLSESRIGTSPIVPQAAPRDGVGVFNSNTAVFKLRNALSAGAPDALFRYGTLGRATSGGELERTGWRQHWSVQTLNRPLLVEERQRQGPSEIVTIFGQAGWIGLAGDWNGDGITTIGVYNPAKRRFFLRDNNVSGKASAIFQFGASANWIPLVGDWDGNGTDTIGQFNPDNGRVFLKNTNGPGAHDVTFVIQDAANQIPVVGDWNGDGIDNVGVYNARSGAFALRSSNTDGPVDIYFPFGGPGMVPLRGGNWSGIR